MIANETPKTLDQIEREEIEARLRDFAGNRTHAAQSLGISVRTLQRKLRAWKKCDRNSYRYR